ncbi:hypothetical protein L0152_13925 [bacterium]|nr:hypothetical protein [bacterium]
MNSTIEYRANRPIEFRAWHNKKKIMMHLDELSSGHAATPRIYSNDKKHALYAK